MQKTIRFSSIPHQFCGRKSRPSHLFSLSTSHTRGHAARRLFRVSPCRKGTIHLQISMSSPGFEPFHYGTAVSVANHYNDWVTSWFRYLMSPKSYHVEGLMRRSSKVSVGEMWKSGKQEGQLRSRVHP
ncbi:hypothetical protein TNCV_4215431 [Trichonephila clavipes]|nr:hypothetical protein TNCV_4215431 [Trichonephila clavipes]